MIETTFVVLVAVGAVLVVSLLSCVGLMLIHELMAEVSALRAVVAKITQRLHLLESGCYDDADDIFDDKTVDEFLRRIK